MFMQNGWKLGRVPQHPVVQACAVVMHVVVLLAFCRWNMWMCGLFVTCDAILLSVLALMPTWPGTRMWLLSPKQHFVVTIVALCTAAWGLFAIGVHLISVDHNHATTNDWAFWMYCIFTMAWRGCPDWMFVVLFSLGLCGVYVLYLALSLFVMLATLGSEIGETTISLRPMADAR